jgi:hypothetical protein
MPINK